MWVQEMERERGDVGCVTSEKFRIRDTLGQPRKGTKADARGGGCEKRKVSCSMLRLGAVISLVSSVEHHARSLERGACVRPGGVCRRRFVCKRFTLY